MKRLIVLLSACGWLCLSLASTAKGIWETPQIYDVNDSLAEPSIQGVPLTDQQMGALIAGQGCLGIAGVWLDNDPTCCTTAKGIMYNYGLSLTISGQITRLIAGAYYYANC